MPGVFSFHHCFFAFLTNGGCSHDEQQECCGDEEAETDRRIDEDHGIAARQKQSAPQIFFHHRAKHKTKDQWCRFAIKLEAEIAKLITQRKSIELKLAQ